MKCYLGMLVLAISLPALGTACSRQPQTPWELAQHHFALGQWEAAVRLCDALIDAEPDRADYYVVRGRALLNQGKLPAALEDFTAAIEIDPDDPEAFYQREIAYEELGEHEKAFADGRRTRELDVNYKKAFAFEPPLPPAADLGQFLNSPSSSEEEAAGGDDDSDSIHVQPFDPLADAAEQRETTSPLSVPGDPGGKMLHLESVLPRERRATNSLETPLTETTFLDRWLADRPRSEMPEPEGPRPPGGLPLRGENVSEDGKPESESLTREESTSDRKDVLPPTYLRPSDQPHNVLTRPSWGTNVPWSSTIKPRPTGIVSPSGPAALSGSAVPSSPRAGYAYQPGSGLPVMIPPRQQDTPVTMGPLQGAAGDGTAGASPFPGRRGTGYSSFGRGQNGTAIQPSPTSPPSYFSPHRRRSVPSTGINSRAQQP